MSAIPPGVQYCFWIATVVRREHSRDFYLAFPTLMSLVAKYSTTGEIGTESGLMVS